eukprot:m.285913 g.285913  ORF g.285913 m.285913 type:complete len:73 (+) comp150143_c0_seq1:45-263(+)
MSLGEDEELRSDGDEVSRENQHFPSLVSPNKNQLVQQKSTFPSNQSHTKRKKTSVLSRSNMQAKVFGQQSVG